MQPWREKSNSCKWLKYRKWQIGRQGAKPYLIKKEGRGKHLNVLIGDLLEY